MSTETYRVILNFLKIGTVKPITDIPLQRLLNGQLYFTLEGKWTSIRAYHIYCPIWVQYSVRDLDVTLLSLCGLRENWHIESRVFLHLRIDRETI
jgi:hypothetical protein